MKYLARWDICFFIFHVFLASVVSVLKKNNSMKNLTTTEPEEEPNSETIFRLIVNRDVYTTSRSLDPSEDDEQNETMATSPTSPTTNVDGSLAEKPTERKILIERNLSDTSKALMIDGRRAVYLMDPDKRFTHQSRVPISITIPTEIRTPPVTDDYFLPYLGAKKGSTNGDWVFYEKTGYYQNKVSLWNTWWWRENTKYWPIAPETFHNLCHDFHKRMGKLCAYRMNQDSLKYEYKDFGNWCEMDNANRPWWRTRYYWSVIHLGKCRMTYEFFPDKWSTQDAKYASQSNYIILKAAQLANQEMKWARHASEGEFNYKCRSYNMWYISEYLEQTKACYYFSIHVAYPYWTTAYTYYDAKKICDNIGGRIIDFQSQEEYLLIKRRVERMVDPYYWYYIRFWMPFVRDSTTEDWKDYKTNDRYGELKYPMPALPVELHDKKIFGGNYNDEDDNMICSATSPYQYYINFKWSAANCEGQYYYHVICKRSLIKDERT